MSVADRKQRERTQRRESILEAAGRLFANQPYDAVRVEDISEAAELAKGTVYLYFSDKDTIVAELGNRLLEDMSEKMATVTGEVAAQERSPIDALLAMVRIWLDAYWLSPGLFRILVLDRPQLLAEVTRGEHGNSRLLEPIERVVALSQQRGQMAPSLQPDVFSHALWALFVGGLLLSGRGDIAETDLRSTSLPVLQALVRGLCMPVSSSDVNPTDSEEM